ncbi:hypothetical protein ACFY4C_21070 [Actinomadura viridis]|uniref:hypothetical protein n=1 Tax=Actinomadura viridis TaxID=58110 RepID=UPI0036C69373
MPATTTKTRCETVDQIVRWEDVTEGDLVLYGGRLELVTEITSIGTLSVPLRLRLEGHIAPVTVSRKGLTAVARYIESTEE